MTPSLDWLWYGFAAALALAGLWLTYSALFRDRARGRRRCPRCWYSMEGIPSTTCPECGKVAKSEPALFRTRRRPRIACIAAVCLVGALTCWALPAWKRGGWPALVPNTVLVEVANLLPAQPQAAGSYPWESDLGDEAWLRLLRQEFNAGQRARLISRTLLAMGYTPREILRAPGVWPRHRPMPVKLVERSAAPELRFSFSEDESEPLTACKEGFVRPPAAGPMNIPLRVAFSAAPEFSFVATPSVLLVDRCEEACEAAVGPQWDSFAAHFLAPALEYTDAWRIRIADAAPRGRAAGFENARGPLGGPYNPILACIIEVVQDGRIIATATNAGVWTVMFRDATLLAQLDWKDDPPATLDPSRITLRVRGDCEKALGIWEPHAVDRHRKPLVWLGSFEYPGSRP